METILSTDGLAVGYGGKVVVDGINVEVHSGEVLTLIGSNGSGKSTILRSIAKQLRTLSGNVYLGDNDLRNLNGEQLSKALSIMLTDRTNYELTTCRDVVESGRYPYTGRLGVLSKVDHWHVDQAMELLNVQSIANQDFNRISDGQRQRVLLARAICQETKVLILDEPTSYLDVRYKLELLSTLKTLVREKHIAVVMSLHEIDLAEKVSDYVLCVDNHHVDRYGTPEEVFTEGYVRRLYHIQDGYFNETFSSPELPSNRGTPKVFVVCGNGSGIPTFRRLQRQNVPFAVGVLHTNDVDYPVAKLLASKVITETPFEPITETHLAEALAVLKSCETVLCCLDSFGTINLKNRILAQYAHKERP